MKPNFDLLKSILQYLEDKSNGVDTVWCTPKDITIDCTQNEINYHLMIMNDDNLLVVHDISMMGDFAITRLTAEGHRVLEAMNTDQIQSQLKDFLNEVGQASIKQIPALAIKLILG